ncbi:MAG: hypothetical protein WCS99_14210 [Limisphaerales bacterium]
MKPSSLSRPLFAVLCGLSIAALPDAGRAQDRPPEGQRPPRGDFRPGDTSGGDRREGGPRREESRRDDAPRGERGEGQRPQFNPQELFRDLNDDQRDALRGFFESIQGVMRETGEKSMRLRREIVESSMADKPNEGLIRDKIMEAAKLEAEATIARVRAFADVREKLPKETVERLRGMIAGMGPRPGMQGQQPGGSRDGNFRRPGAEGDRRPEQPRRAPAEQ